MCFSAFVLVPRRLGEERADQPAEQADPLVLLVVLARERVLLPLSPPAALHDENKMEDLGGGTLESLIVASFLSLFLEQNGKSPESSPLEAFH